MSGVRLYCVGTHHKTGTVWMRRVWREIGETLGIPFIGVHRPGIWREKVPQTGRAIVVNWGGKFAPDLWDQSDARFMHIIRDPRDVLLSGARYHETTTAPTEKFLHKPRKDLDGKTYQQHMQSLSRPEDKLAFEMAEMHAKTLDEMLAWPYGHDRAFDIRYEDLIVDTDCELFARALAFFELSKTEIETCKGIFFQNSIFGGLAADPSQGRTKNHVKSGKPAQWITKMPPETAELYRKTHAKDLVSLGYEQDENWLERLQPAEETAV
jgi:hypothetical protein